jgi:hypothetical protein
VLQAFGKLQAQITSIGARNAANGYVGTGADGRMAVAQLPQNLISSTTYEAAWKTGTLSVSGSVFTLVGHGFASGDPVEFRANTGVLPTGVLPFDSDNIGGTYYNVTVLDVNTFEIYSNVARTIKITPSGTGTAGYQIRLGGFSSQNITGLDFSVCDNYLIEISRVGQVRKNATTNSLCVNRLIQSNGTAISSTYFNGIDYAAYSDTFSFCDTQHFKKYSVSKITIEIRKISSNTYNISSRQSGGASDDKSSAITFLNFQGGSMAVAGVGTVNGLSIGINNLNNALIRNGITVNVWRVN